MAFKLRSGFPETQAFSYPVTAGTAITAGTVLVINGNVVAAADANATIHTIVAVAAESIGTGPSSILAIPILGPGQVWEADCVNNTHASNQLFESGILDSTGLLFNNTASDVTGPTGVFTPFANVGAVADKKVLGEFTRLQSTST
jgi:hypothetical protein